MKEKFMEMICLRCDTKLVTFKYEGYYDSFYGYKCSCKVLPKETDSRFIKGAYAMCGDEWEYPEYDCEYYKDKRGHNRRRKIQINPPKDLV